MSMPIGLWYINEPIHTHKQARTKTHTEALTQDVNLGFLRRSVFSEN